MYADLSTSENPQLRDENAQLQRPVAVDSTSTSLYSIVETAKANGVEPHAYLSLLFARLPHARTVEDFEALLPWNVKAELAATASH